MATRLEEVHQSPNDQRAYRAVRLEANGLACLLVSDPETDKAAASMAVHTGSWSDGDVPGLAHFCEHMCFMGSAKYPSVNAYSEYLNAHGGGSNAYTTDCFTNYFFDISPDHLNGALDRFAQFFISPLFDEASTDKEIQAVDNEHSKNMQSDIWREVELLRKAVNPKHPMSRFSTGTAATLRDEPAARGLNIRQVLLDFHKKYYSANLMRLVIYGKESLDTLEAEAVERFSGIENRDAVSIEDEVTVLPFLSEALPKVLYQIPVTEDRKVCCLWALPSVYEDVYAKPLNYYSHLFGHEGAGSLLSYLKKKGYANGLSAGMYQNHKTYAVFMVDVELTPEGLDARVEVTEAIFAYAEMLREQGPQEWIHAEMRKLKHAEFEYLQKSEPMNYVMGLTMKGFRVDLPEVLKCDHIVGDFDEALLRRIADGFRPDHFLALVSAPSFEFELPNELPYYGGQYLVADVAPETLERYRNPAPIADLRLPDPNPFLTDDFALVAAPTNLPPIPTVHANAKVPHRVFHDGVIDVYYKHDASFRVPKGSICLKLNVPAILGSPALQMAGDLFIDVLKEALNELGYQASCANLNYDISAARGGLNISMTGFSQKLPALLEAILQYFTSEETLAPTEATLSTFKRLKEAQIRDLKNRDFDQPYHFAFNARNVSFIDPFWSYPQKLRALETLNLDDLVAFRRMTLRDLTIRLLVHGNFTLAHVGGIVQSLRAGFFPAGSAPATATGLAPTPPGRVVDLVGAAPEPGASGVTYRLNVRHPNDEEPNSCCFVETFLGELTVGHWARAKLLQSLLREPAFNQLRADEQLGYIVHTTETKILEKLVFLSLIVQSNFAPPEYLHARIRKFFTDFTKSLAAMDDEVFESTRAATVEDLTQKTKSLQEESRQVWNRMESGSCAFQYKFRAAEVIAQLSKSDMVTMLEERFLAGPQRLRVVLQVTPKTFPLPGDEGYEAMLEEWARKHEEQDGRAEGESEPAVDVEAFADGPFIEVDDAFDFKARAALLPDTCAIAETHAVVGEGLLEGLEAAQD